MGARCSRETSPCSKEIGAVTEGAGGQAPGCCSSSRSEKLECSGLTKAADSDCRVCFERKINTLLAPCGHLALCRECADSVLTCPICRTKVVSRHQAYFA